MPHQPALRAEHGERGVLVQGGAGGLAGRLPAPARLHPQQDRHAEAARPELPGNPGPLHGRRSQQGSGFLILPKRCEGNVFFQVTDESNLASSSLAESGNSQDLLGVVVSYSVRWGITVVASVTGRNYSWCALPRQGEAGAERDGRGAGD